MQNVISTDEQRLGDGDEWQAWLGEDWEELERLLEALSSLDLGGQQWDPYLNSHLSRFKPNRLPSKG